jgi:hypothetical protein
MIAALLLGLILVCALGIALIVREMRVSRRAAALHAIIGIFPPLLGGEEDPRQLLRWAPLASTARRLFPTEFAHLDKAVDDTFPFGKRQTEAAHARWTADWLAWEGSHDEEYRLKTAALEAEIGRGQDASLGRARLAALEREKLERYQQRYEEYIRVAKALAALDPRESPRPT